MKSRIILALGVLGVPFFILAATTDGTAKPIFLKTPRAMVTFSEVRISDAEADRPVSYTLTCDRSLLPSPGGKLLTFRVKPHTHYNCQLLAEDAAGNGALRDITFDTQEWIEIAGLEATSTIGTSVPLGTVTITNYSARDITPTVLPVKLRWAFSGTPASPNVGVLAMLAVRDMNGNVLGRNDFLLDAAEKMNELKVDVNPVQLPPDQRLQLHLALEHLSTPLRPGESVEIESASTTRPIEVTPAGIAETGGFRFQRIAAGMSAAPLPAEPKTSPSLSTPPAAILPTLLARDLGIGSRGDDVRRLQQLLATDGSVYPEAIISGYFGQKTAQAVRRFQARYGLPTVGRIGPKTREKINGMLPSGKLSPVPPLLPTPAPPPVLPPKPPPAATQTQKVKSGPSPYRGEITIASVAYGGETPENEYLILRRSGSSSAQSAIDVTGWTVENNRGGEVNIPAAMNIVSVDTLPSRIQLKSGGAVIMVTGVGYGTSFRENICTEYLTESNAFDPPLERSCPQFSRDDLLRRRLSGACIDLVTQQPPCRQVRINFQSAAADNECIAFARDHLNYSGCVQDNRASNEFLLDTWRVFLRRDSNFFNPRHDLVRLRDRDGLVVDEYPY